MVLTDASPRARFAVVDVETTGFNPNDDRVVEMACVVVERGRVASRWTTLVDPERAIPTYATRVHGLTDDDVRGAPRFRDAQRELARRCGDAIVVAHNASFDRAFLPALAHRPWLCTLAYARSAFPDAPNHRNQTLRTYLGLDAQRRLYAVSPTAHRALDDALVTVGVLLRCLERLPPRVRWFADAA